jgi:hypothetical protein
MSGRQLTTRYESSARIAAPVDQVWAETGSLKQVLQSGHQVTGLDLASDGNSAIVSGFVSWGAIRWELSGVATVRRIVARRQLEWVCDIARYGFQLTGKVQLEAVSNGGTTVSYDVFGSMPRKTLLHVPFWRVIDADVVTQVDHFLDRIGKLSEQHVRARRQLGDGSADIR